MTSPTLLLVAGIVLGIALPWLATRLFRVFTVSVDDNEAVLILQFGKLVSTLTRPGLHWVLSRPLPWVSIRRVSLRRDYRTFDRIHVNDAKGTTLIVDLWLEMRILDPSRALFSVTDWDASMKNVVTHAAISILGDREFHQILTDRTELGERLRREVQAETSRWGVAIELLFIRNVTLLPEVARQVFETVAARLERATADIEEEGRIDVALLEARTSARVAELVATAKGQYPAAVGRAFATLKPQPRVLEAYNELYALAQLRPHRTVAFRGFNGQLRPLDAAMLPEGTEAARLPPPALGEE